MLTETRSTALDMAGTDVRGAQSAHVALEAAGLAGWNVRKVPLLAEAYGPGNAIVVPDKYATIRTNLATGRPDYLAVVGKQYHVTQNEEHAEFLDLLVDEAQATYANAASLRGGKLVYLSIKLPDIVQVGGVDPIDLYLNAINSHDGSTNFMVSIDPVRAWCSNQLNYFRRNALAFRHTQSIKGKVQVAREALNLTFKARDEFTEQADQLVHQSMTDDEFEKIVEELWPVPRVSEGEELSRRAATEYDKLRDTLTYLYRKAPTNALIRGTRWGGLQATIEYLDWETRVRRIKGETVEASRAEKILTSPAMIKIKDRAIKAFASDRL